MEDVKKYVAPSSRTRFSWPLSLLSSTFVIVINAPLTKTSHANIGPVICFLIALFGGCALGRSIYLFDTSHFKMLMECPKLCSKSQRTVLSTFCRRANGQTRHTTLYTVFSSHLRADLNPSDSTGTPNIQISSLQYTSFV
jgi:hypothetical protein